MPFNAYEGEHVGTLERVRTGYLVVACACGWRTARHLDEEYVWRQHHSHVRVEANMFDMQQRIHGKHP